MPALQKKLTDVSDVPVTNVSGHLRDADTSSFQKSILVSGSAEPKRRYLGALVSRNVNINGHRTSIRLEPEMWEGLREICRRERQSLHQVCTVAALHKTEMSSLTASVRVYVMRYFREAATDDGHIKAGHHAGPACGMDTYIASRYGKTVVPLGKTSFA